MKGKNIYFEVKDHSVSGEEFKLVYNKALDMLETFPQPREEDLSKYYQSEDYISHTDSKRNLLEKVYHIVRSISLKRKLKLINNFRTADRNLLDIGCGTGDFLNAAFNNKWNVTGIEPDENARTIAKEKVGESVYDVSHLLQLEPKSFDVITLWHVLEHLPNLEEHISIIETLLKDDGCLVVAVPNHKSYDAKHYGQFWAAYDVPRHLWHFSKKSIATLFSKYSMKNVKTLPMKFDAFYVSLLSEKYKSGFMNPIKAFYRGLLSNVKAKRSGEYSSLIYILKKSLN